MSGGIPFIEFYRPTHFDDIVLDPLNKKILKNIIDTGYFPNLLFYGPPGTGKTTTIINLINAYQEKTNTKNKDLVIHLNASDERGIDIIRNQINFFVNSKPLFHNGMKFVIFDEVDYMTKNAQQALRYLLQDYSNNVRFCLIGNYISKIDEGLQNEFLKLRFNQLPEKEIVAFLKKISISENLNFSDKTLECIQKQRKSDVRSMINFIQTNQDIIRCKNSKENSNTFFDMDFKIIDDSTWEELYNMLVNEKNNSTFLDNICVFVQNISLSYNIDKKNIIKDFLNYIIRNKPNTLSGKFLDFVENAMHSQDCNNNVFVRYSLSKLSSFC
jgi:DNA polymerase III delta prime subunit